MKTLKTILGLLGAASMATSCLNDDEAYNAGFVFYRPDRPVTTFFANNRADSLIFFSYGDWIIRDGNYDNAWVTLPFTSGKGEVWNIGRVDIAENTTGKSRVAGFVITDANHPSAGSSSFYYLQTATRGDGSLGFAPDVKTITGTDGADFAFAYDALHRPTSLLMKKHGNVVRHLTIDYNDTDSVMTVTDGSLTYDKAHYGRSYQADQLKTDDDLIGCFVVQDVYMGYYMNNRFDYRRMHRSQNDTTAIRYIFPKQGVSLVADSLHNADSLYFYKSNELQQRYGLTYSQYDNRCQTVDANQLIFGVDNCDPYLLLSMFSIARNSNIISLAKADDGEISVATELNADKSVASMTVTRGGETITYTFGY
ncbi:MAG: hypothetical protein J6M25_02085 [Prevotella sp.]|nr:hypothetical protein [Prevotella sp.]